MSGTLTHSPAQILRQLLIDLNLAESSGDWTCRYSHAPDTPDKAVITFDTEGRTQGRTHVDGETQIAHGVQVQVRGTPEHAVGYLKAQQIAVGLDGFSRATVAIGATSYLVQAVTRTSDVISLGVGDASRRRLFTINGVMSVRQV